MSNSAKIAISLPKTGKSRSRLSLKLKNDLNKERAVFVKPQKIFVISDIEGNFNALIQLLRRGKVIDRKLRWTFGDGHLVIVGDVFDRGEQVMECLWLIYSLEEKAASEGGYVHFLLGNHEIMNMNGDWRYVHPQYTQSSTVPYTALYNGNSELWHWLCTKNIIEKIGDILFVHGGISSAILELQLPVANINNKVRPYYNKMDQLFTDPLLQIVFNSDDSPFWYRGYYKTDTTMTTELIDATLTQYDVKTIVTGHTVVSQVTPYFNGKVINIDTDHANGQSEALFIRGQRYYRIPLKGKRERIK